MSNLIINIYRWNQEGFGESFGQLFESYGYAQSSKLGVLESSTRVGACYEEPFAHKKIQGDPADCIVLCTDGLLCCRW